MIYLFKTLGIFTRTFYYLIRSYQKDADITALKKQWALDILEEFDFDIVVNNKIKHAQQVILVGNHISYLDIIVLMAIHPQSVFLSKKEVASWPIIGAGAKRMGTIFVDRSCAESRAQTKEKIKSIFSDKSKPVHIAGFPSGTTCLTESKPWKKGLFEIAQQNDLLVQPFKISYSPIRECAYVDQDNLFFSLMTLFKTKNKKIIFEWGNSFKVTDLANQIEQTKSWSKPTPERKARSGQNRWVEATI